MRQPRQISLVTLRLQKLEDRARPSGQSVLRAVGVDIGGRLDLLRRLDEWVGRRRG